MADISLTLLSEGGGSGGSGSIATTSTAPKNGYAHILLIRARNNSGAAGTPSSISGNGLTWTLIQSQADSGNGCYIYKGVGTPSSGQITITFSAARSTISYKFLEFANVDPVDPLQGSNSAGSNFNGSSATLNLSAFTNTKNAALGWFMAINAIQTMTAGSGFTQIGTKDFDGDDSLIAEWKLNDNSVDASSTGTPAWIAAAMELKFKAMGTGFFNIL